ncbi:2-methoxy-6-polyprenyl-1,4-benzoquinol methylase, mitochondrial-like [Lycium ferocissimum]|uniref:2-methoxy-6-polyprenyl-1,4-benzoquinol methylase, mitochondrial-like n=1 Tax=Lycium ferocissimum TaxID=112874 RepID=UPI0028165AD1|nr:2-methoxy-6-polyprenyl-1,4-benzoquinol methylase, mitochondrial-like [Lycium ferocissimum]
MLQNKVIDECTDPPYVPDKGKRVSVWYSYGISRFAFIGCKKILEEEKSKMVIRVEMFPKFTRDIAFRILEDIKNVKHRAIQDVEDDLIEDTRIYVCDINPNMLSVGKKRAEDRGFGRDKSLTWVEIDAEALNFEGNSMDGYTIASGNWNAIHIEKVLAEAYREFQKYFSLVHKRGGRFLCLELSHVDISDFRNLYYVYSFSVIPVVGELVTMYFVISVRRYCSRDVFAKMIVEARLPKVEYESLVGGVAAIHSGLKF